MRVWCSAERCPQCAVWLDSVPHVALWSCVLANRCASAGNQGRTLTPPLPATCASAGHSTGLWYTYNLQPAAGCLSLWTAAVSRMAAPAVPVLSRLSER